MRYHTAFGMQLVFVGGGLGLGVGATISWWFDSWPMLSLGLTSLALLGWILLGTRYIVREGVLDIRCGPVHKRIPLGDITGVHRRMLDRGLMLGLGSDFIGIEYDGKVVHISPRNVEGFVEAISEALEAREDPILALRGRGRELWRDEDADAYVRRLRSDWR